MAVLRAHYCAGTSAWLKGEREGGGVAGSSDALGMLVCSALLCSGTGQMRKVLEPAFWEEVLGLG